MPPRPDRLLRAWERGVGRPLADAARLALEALSPAGTPVAAALHARDAALLRARMALRGPMLDAVVRCPHCTEVFDLTLDLGALAAPVAPAAPVTVRLGGWEARVRPPVEQDLEALEGLSPAAFAAALFRRCVEAATCDGLAVAVTELPAELRAAAAAALAAQGMEGPAADLTCGACAHAWRAPLDVARVVIGELEAWARRELAEVHRIAHAYHWREADILRLSPVRRRFYLEAIGLEALR
ncbi:hypothetical protein E2C06_13270 [Dankookia rubra]|uniref:Phage baseplate protein n=1 Tax=Dankookia rubra TaxID=1442381 RepID=A0A4R5QH90_9PROT|nr:hypothetical protein [Dankookia rubra]TDH62139.1 hypothetical protein E2C06_13270 [Dankookia rubra]